MPLLITPARLATATAGLLLAVGAPAAYASLGDGPTAAPAAAAR